MAGTALHGRLTWQATAVTSVTRETASVVTIELEPPHWPGHRAGQHLEVRLTAEDGYTAEREYSIASALGEPLAITVERLEDGEVAPYLTRELHAGDELELRGSIGGYFVWDHGDGGPLMLLVGGSGIVPLRFILRHRRRTCRRRQFSVRPRRGGGRRLPPSGLRERRELVGYAVQPDGSRDEITSATIPYQSPQGLT